MAYEVKLSKRAISDLRHIYGAIGAEDSHAAERWFRGLEATIFSLESEPARGAIARDRPSLRHLLYGNKPHIYRILYTFSESAQIVNVAQIRHGGRQPLSSKRP